MCVVKAWDADDEEEGRNAKLTYSIEKNALHETSGVALFKVGDITVTQS